jgi:hypothetical protein
MANRNRRSSAIDHQTALGMQFPNRQVVGDREMRKEIQLLEDHAHVRWPVHEIVARDPLELRPR